MQTDYIESKVSIKEPGASSHPSPVGNEEPSLDVLLTTEFGILPIPRWLCYSPQSPFPFSYTKIGVYAVSTTISTYQSTSDVRSMCLTSFSFRESLLLSAFIKYDFQYCMLFVWALTVLNKSKCQNHSMFPTKRYRGACCRTIFFFNRSV